jgi:hypothetical protein
LAEHFYVPVRAMHVRCCLLHGHPIAPGCYGIENGILFVHQRHLYAKLFQLFYGA